MKENGTFLRGLEGVRRVFHPMNRVFGWQDHSVLLHHIPNNQNLRAGYSTGGRQ